MGSTKHIFLLTHGSWGKYLLESTESMVGKIDHIKYYFLLAGDRLDDYQAMVEADVKEAEEEGILLITDLKGSSTYNIAAALCLRYSICAVTGLAMGLLINADELRDGHSVETLADALVKESAESVINVKKMVKEELEKTM